MTVEGRSGVDPEDTAVTQLVSRGVRQRCDDDKADRDVGVEFQRVGFDLWRQFLYVE